MPVATPVGGIPTITRPGEELDYVKVLKAKNLWPPKMHVPALDPTKPVTTPYLVIPATPDDNGTGTRKPATQWYSQSITLIDTATGISIDAVHDKPKPGEASSTRRGYPVLGKQYQIVCRVVNLGAFPCYGGLADFFIGSAVAFKNAVYGAAIPPSPAPPQAWGRTGFIVQQGQEVIVTCPKLWAPTQADFDAHRTAIAVHAFDPFCDNLTSKKRFDAHDRHVGRMDFFYSATV